jgi:hypothetical protein
MIMLAIVLRVVVTFRFDQNATKDQDTQTAAQDKTMNYSA